MRCATFQSVAPGASVKYEPAVDRTGLIDTVRDRYGFPVDRLEFVPVGYAAAC